MSEVVLPGARPFGSRWGLHALGEGLWGWRAVQAMSLLVYVFMFAPILVTMVLSFNASQFGGFPMTGFSFRWFGVLMQNYTVLRAFRVSLIIGSATALICTVLGILAAMALVRYDFPGNLVIYFVFLAGMMVPGFLGMITMIRRGSSRALSTTVSMSMGNTRGLA